MKIRKYAHGFLRKISVSQVLSMKVRDSGMPEEAYWEALFDIPEVLDRLQIDSSLCEVAEVGCGYGTFTLPVARRVPGTLHAFDIEASLAVCV